VCCIVGDCLNAKLSTVSLAGNDKTKIADKSPVVPGKQSRHFNPVGVLEFVGVFRSEDGLETSQRPRKYYQVGEAQRVFIVHAGGQRPHIVSVGVGGGGIGGLLLGGSKYGSGAGQRSASSSRR